MDGAVDLWRIGAAASLADAIFEGIDDHLQALPDLVFQDRGADRLLLFHEAAIAALLLLVGHHRKAEIIGHGALHGLVFEGADPVEARFAQPVQQHLEVLLCLAGKANDEGGADSQVRASLPPGLHPVQRLLLIARAAHGL